MTQGRECPLPCRIAKELSVGFRGRSPIESAQPKAARTCHTELAAHRVPAMRRANAHAQVAAQQRRRQGSRSILRTRDLVRMTRMQIPRGKPTCQRKRARRKSIAKLIRIPIKAICKEKQG